MDLLRIGLIAPRDTGSGAGSGALGWWWPPILTAQARCHQFGKVDHGVMLSLLRLEIALVKTMKDGMGHKQHEPQDEDTVGVMMKVVIGVPVRYQFIEAFVLYLPSIMT